MPNIIKQGVDCWIIASNIVDVRTGNSITVTGYHVHAVARARYARRVLGQYRGFSARMQEPVIAEWDTSPTGTQGTITAGGDVPDQVQIHITPTQTNNWKSPLAVIQAFMTDPLNGEIARIVNEVFEVDWSAGIPN